MRAAHPAWGVVGALGLLLGGCAQDGSAIDDIVGGDLKPTLASIQANIFTPICTDCHFPGGPGPMPLDTEQHSYDNLVDAGSIELLMLRVAPGDPESSYLVWKIQDRDTIVLDPMPPPPQPRLTPEQINAIVEWIENGALR